MRHRPRAGGNHAPRLDRSSAACPGLEFSKCSRERLRRRRGRNKRGGSAASPRNAAGVHRMIARRSGHLIACGWGAFVFLLTLTACSGPQSSLDPAGLGADRIATLFWWMTAGALCVWVAVVWLAVSAIRGRVSEHTERQARLYVIGGGAILPTVALTGLLLYG